jgi:membrane-bound lytic murein transglycosylase D
LPVFSFFASKNAAILFLLFVIASLLLAFGCASSRGRVSPLNRAQNVQTQVAYDSIVAAQEAPDTGAYADSGEYGDSLAAEEDDTIYDDPGDLIEVAKSYIEDGNFASADSTLKEAVKAVENLDQANEGARKLPASRYFEQIAAVYKDKMPAAFPIPEDITMAVFQGQMMRSIDSMNVLPSDSISLAALACQKNLAYDIPIVWNQRVQRALYFYLRNRENTVDHWFYRASYYLPVMKKMFADSGLPQDLAYLPLIESGFNPLAYSYANASGIWQFIASTGKIYGLRRNFWVDERRDPIRSTEAAIGYLKKLYGEFGHWHLALAAYNCGENGVSRSIARHNTNDYWNLKRLPKQTKNYVPCYLAALTIAKNPKCFGVVMPTTGTLPLDTVRLSGCVSLGDIAAGLNVEYDTLRKMNPHIMRWCTPPDMTNTLLYLPAGKKKAWSGFYAQLPPEKRVRWLRYEIKRNDTIENIAGQHNMPADALISINRITTVKLTPGHHLFIPLSDTTLGMEAAYTLPPESEIKALDLPDYEFSGVAVRHRIRPGDNLGRIARRYHVTVNQLCRWNHIAGRTILRPGRVLVVSRPLPPVEAPVVASAAISRTRPPVETAPKPVVASAAAISLPVSPVETALKPVVAPAAIGQAATGQMHVVRIGDTPFSISRKYSITVQELAALNGLDMAHPRIKIGQTLKISSSAPSQTVRLNTAPTAPVKPDTVSKEVSSAHKEKNYKESDLDSVNNGSSSGSGAKKSAETQLKAENRRHVVSKGENLFKISQQYSVSTASIIAANRIADESLVRAGDTLLIPSAFGTTTPPPAKAAAPSDIIYYKVKEGDTLLRIAAAFGVPVDSLYMENNLKPDSVVSPGKIIKVIGK